MGLSLGDVDTDKVATLTAHEEAEFRSRRTRSRELWKEALEYIPRGVPSSFQDTPPQPVFIDHGKGSRVWDVDGNEYVDFHNGFGVMVVGHAHPAIVAAVESQIHRGPHFAQPVAENIVVARELARRFHQPQWRFTNSGTESTLDAIRLARGFTNRERIIKIEASYHGHHDALLVSVEPPVDAMGDAEFPNSVPMTGGIPASTVELTTVVGFNDLASLERAFVAHPGEVAGVIVEPAMMNIGFVLPDDGYLAGVVEIAHRHGAVVIFDEVKTGVTIAPGGATERFGVVPDIVCLAKAIGGGLPCGRRSCRHHGDDQRRQGRPARHLQRQSAHHGGVAGDAHRGAHRSGVFAAARAHRIRGRRPARGYVRVQAAVPRGLEGCARLDGLPRASEAQLPSLRGDGQEACLRVLAL